MFETNWLDVLPPDVIDTIWFYVHRNKMGRILRTINRMHTKFCLWRKPSQRLLDLTVNDIGCLQHPHTDLDKFRNKEFCSGACYCLYSLYSGQMCVECAVIDMKSPWTLPNDYVYKCRNCVAYGFPCSNCERLFNGWVAPHIFHANF